MLKFHIVNVRRGVIAPGGKCFGITTPPFSGLVFPLHGRARMFFNQVPYEMEQGKIFHFGPNMSLDKEVIGDAYWDYIVIQYELQAESDATQYSLCHYEVDSRFSPRLHEILLQMYLQCAIPKQFIEQKAKKIFFDVLNESLPDTSSPNHENARTLVDQAMNFITTHYMNPVTIPKLAEHYGLKTKQFAYLFRKYTGVSPNEYLIDYRIHRAHELLCHSKCSVAEVSACVGYSDPYYFSRLFKKRTGFSPSLLRNTKRNAISK
ncbi:MAG: transcriptional regulator, AraC family [Firmicutes bacterium]|nr:transcriptional regulator, AraC family [Bacillota bacterium]